MLVSFPTACPINNKLCFFASFEQSKPLSKKMTMDLCVFCFKAKFYFAGDLTFLPGWHNGPWFGLGHSVVFWIMDICRDGEGEFFLKPVYLGIPLFCGVVLFDLFG